VNGPSEQVIVTVPPHASSAVPQVLARSAHVFGVQATGMHSPQLTLPPQASSCGVLNRFGQNLCSALGSPWRCDGDPDGLRESDLVSAQSEQINAFQLYRSSATGLDRAQGTILRNSNISIDAVRALR